MGLKQKAIAGVAWNTVAKVTASVISIAQLAVVARYVDKADFGLVSTVHVVLGLVMMFSDLGMYAAMMHKQDITEEQYSSIYWMNWVLNLGLYAIICAIAYPVSLFYGEPQLTKLIIVLGIGGLLGCFGKVFYTIKQKNLEFGFISIVTILGQVITLVATIVMATSGCGVWSLIVPGLISSAIGAVIYSWEGRKTMRIHWHFNFQEIREMFHIGLWDTGAQLLDYVCYKLDVLLIGKLFGMETLGLYNIGKELAMKAFKMLNPIVNSVATPILAKLQKERDRLEENYLLILRILTFICFPILFALCIFAEPTITLFFSERYQGSAPFVSILCFWAMFACIGNPAGNLVIATGRTDLEFKWTVVRLICVPVAVVLASFFSPIAIAWSQVILQAIFFYIYWRMMIYTSAHISLSHYVGSLMPATISCVIAAVPSFLFHYFLNLNIWVDLIGGCAIFAMVYFVASWILNRRMFDFAKNIALTIVQKR